MSTTVQQGSPQTLALYAGEILTVTADSLSSGSVVSLGKPGDAPATPAAVAAGTTQTLGPFTDTKHYRVEANAGTLTVATAKADFAAADIADQAAATAAAIVSRKAATIAGGAAGDHTLAAISIGDALVSVVYYVGAGVAVTDVVDLTSEFTVGAGKINNAAGTNTTGGKLVVLYNDLTP